MSISKISILCIGAVVAMLGLASPASAQASRTWVSGVGDDANPCSRTAPCKTFAGAISKTAAGGEIDCLDPGGFGAVTITKAILIDCSGTFGSVLVSGTNGIVVAAGPADRVVLRGIAINGIGSGINGIRFLSGAQLSVEKCAIYGFTTNGIDIAMSAAAAVFVTNTFITKVGNDGIRAATTAGNLQVQVAGTVIEAPTQHGFEAGGGSVIAAITNSVIGTAGGSGVIASAGGAQLNVDTTTVDNSTIAFNAAVSGVTLRVANNSIFNNGINFNIVAGGTVASAGNNRITPAGGSAPNAVLTVQ